MVLLPDVHCHADAHYIISCRCTFYTTFSFSATYVVRLSSNVCSCVLVAKE